MKRLSDKEFRALKIGTKICIHQIEDLSDHAPFKKLPVFAWVIAIDEEEIGAITLGFSGTTKLGWPIAKKRGYPEHIRWGWNVYKGEYTDGDIITLASIKAQKIHELIEKHYDEFTAKRRRAAKAKLPKVRGRKHTKRVKAPRRRGLAVL
jgi:hypothetical protein